MSCNKQSNQNISYLHNKYLYLTQLAHQTEMSTISQTVAENFFTKPFAI